MLQIKTQWRGDHQSIIRICIKKIWTKFWSIKTTKLLPHTTRTKKHSNFLTINKANRPFQAKKVQKLIELFRIVNNSKSSTSITSQTTRMGQFLRQLTTFTSTIYLRALQTSTANLTLSRGKESRCRVTELETSSRMGKIQGEIIHSCEEVISALADLNVIIRMHTSCCKPTSLAVNYYQTS